jgi:hypothetical protein
MHHVEEVGDLALVRFEAEGYDNVSHGFNAPRSAPRIFLWVLIGKEEPASTEDSDGEQAPAEEE